MFGEGGILCGGNLLGKEVELNLGFLFKNGLRMRRLIVKLNGLVKSVTKIVEGCLRVTKVSIFEGRIRIRIRKIYFSS